MIRFWVLVLFCISLAFAAYLGFASLSLGHDKVIHFVTFFILTAEFYFLWEIHRPWKITLVMMTFGASIASEYLQNFVNPNRKFDYVDIIYNVHGSALAVATCCLIHRYISCRRQSSRNHLYGQSNDGRNDFEGLINVQMSEVDSAGESRQACGEAL